MYNDNLNVTNKIITNNDLVDIFQKMDEEIRKNIQICKQETAQNQMYELAYQHWTTKSFEGAYKCTFDFYDNTNVTTDNYNDFINIFNKRLSEIKNIWVRYTFGYWIQSGEKQKSINQSIYLNIYEDKMDIEVNLCSDDKKMDIIYQFIKDKITAAPEKYDRVIKKKSLIINKIRFSFGIFPSLSICTLLVIIPNIRHLYGITYVLYPLVAIILSLLIGGILFKGKLDNLYSTIISKKKRKGNMNDCEVLIGKSTNNINNRKEILELEKEYSKSIPIRLIILLVLSIMVVVISKLL